MSQSPHSPQNEDGLPHFAYFDKHTQLSFVWDGVSDHLEVCHGGYGEPVTDRFPLREFGQLANATAQGWMDWFRSVCEFYLITSADEKERHDRATPPDGPPA